MGVCYLLGILEAVTDSGEFYQILGISFTFIPVIAALIAKRITGVKAKYHLSLRVWKNMRYWLLSALVPGILVAIGATIYFRAVPQHFLVSMVTSMHKSLPTASFRFHLTINTLAVQLYTSLLPRRVRDLHPLERAHGAQTN